VLQIDGIELTQSTIKDFLRFQTPAHNSRVLGNGIDWPSVSVVERHGGRLWLNSSWQRQHFYFSIPDHQSMNP
jgi:light-regulated signal transduction histidine kinase (bacteriophytochrome)